MKYALIIGSTVVAAAAVVFFVWKPFKTTKTVKAKA
jgi:hypothetical protein